MGKDYTSIKPYADPAQGDNSAGALILEEPMAQAYFTGGRSAVADEDLNGDADDGIDWSGLPAHLTVNNLEELYRKLDEAEEDEKAGRVIWLDDAIDEILRDIENGAI